MYYIELHSTPKILKLGFGWALYDREKPYKSDGKYIDYEIPNAITFEEDLEKWLKKSRIVYLKEPEFKAMEKVYEIKTSKKWYIIQIDFEEGNYHIYCHDNIEYPGRRSYKTFPIKDLSHYYPGQEEESFKYVREVKVLNNTLGKDSPKGIYMAKWQEVEEPLLNHMSPGQDDTTQFQKDVDNGIILAITKQ